MKHGSIKHHMHLLKIFCLFMGLIEEFPQPDQLWSTVCVKTQNDAGIYDSCWYLRRMLVFALNAAIVNSSMKCKYQHEL